MPKPTEKLYKIGELIERTGLSRQTLHNYTMLGLIQPKRRTQSGHRLYPEDVFDTLDRVKELRSSHTLAEIREMLSA